MLLNRPRFTLLRAMTSIAVTAVGFALAMAYFRSVDNSYRPRPLSLQLLAVMPCLSLWSITLILLSSRPPRLRRLALKPGFAACLATAFGTVVGLLVAALQLKAARPWSSWPIHGSQGVLLAVSNTPLPMGTAVGAVWMLLFLAGKWKLEREPTEILGFILGLSSIAICIVLIAATLDWF